MLLLRALLGCGLTSVCGETSESFSSLGRAIVSFVSARMRKLCAMIYMFELCLRLSFHVTFVVASQRLAACNIATCNHVFMRRIVCYHSDISLFLRACPSLRT